MMNERGPPVSTYASGFLCGTCGIKFRSRQAYDKHSCESGSGKRRRRAREDAAVSRTPSLLCSGLAAGGSSKDHHRPALSSPSLLSRSSLNLLPGLPCKNIDDSDQGALRGSTSPTSGAATFRFESGHEHRWDGAGYDDDDDEDMGQDGGGNMYDTGYEHETGELEDVEQGGGGDGEAKDGQRDEEEGAPREGLTSICLDDSDCGGDDDDVPDGLSSTGSESSSDMPVLGEVRSGRGDDGPDVDRTRPPWLDEVHAGLESMKRRQLLDGGRESLRYSEEAIKSSSDYFPYDNFTQAVLATFVRQTSPSRAQQDVLFNCLRQKDKYGNGICPADVPESADHFSRRMRARTPLLPVYGERVEEKRGGGGTKLVASIPANLVIQRSLESPAFVENLLNNRVGHILSEADREGCRVPHRHILPIPTRASAGRREGVMFGDIAHCSSIFGIESIVIGRDERETKVVAGDTVLVRLSTQGTGSAPRAHRLESVVWVEGAGEGEEQQDSGRLVARVQPFVLNNEIAAACALPMDDNASDAVVGVWEVTNDRQEVELASLVGRCDVLVDGQAAGDDAQPAVPRFRGVGFVTKRRGGSYKLVPSPDSSEKYLPWRQEGVERLFYDRRKDGVHWNRDPQRPVLCTPGQLFTDGFNFYKQGGVGYSINATLLNAFASTTRAFRRQPESWPLVSLGAPKVRWQDDLEFVTEVIGELQKGCLARMVGAEGEEEIFFRLGLVSCCADSPARGALIDGKSMNNKTEMPCHACDVPQKGLADGRYDVQRHRRTDDQYEHSLRVVAAATTKTEKQKMSARLGVNAADVTNPLRKNVHLNMVRQIGVDIFHQDAQNSARKVLKYVLGGLSTDGVRHIGCLAKDASLRVAGTPPLRDIVQDGGFAAQTGMDVWRLMGVALLVLRPVLLNVRSMKRFLTAPFLKGLKERLENASDTNALDNLRALVLSASEATYHLRSSELSEETIKAIHDSQREKVELMGTMGDKNGGRLCSNHQGLHLSENAADFGMLVDCHAGESRHKVLKSYASTASGRDNELHIIRRQNDAAAARAMEEGLRWQARAFDRERKTWIERTIQASPECRELLKRLSTRSATTRSHNTGRPRGTVEWTIDLGQAAPTPGVDAWQRTIEESVRISGLSGTLLTLYKQWWGCGRVTGDENKCGAPCCPRCWNSRDRGLVSTEVRCCNAWFGAPERTSAGTGTIRGATMVDAAEQASNQWIYCDPPYAMDVEIYCTRGALEAQKAGPAGTCTLGKVAFFFQHTGNPLPGGAPGVVTDWVAVCEYVTVGSGIMEKLDPSTGHAVMRLRRTLSFFPVSAIRRVVHMYHCCTENRCGPYAAGGGKGTAWRHEFETAPANNCFLYNKFFRGPTPSAT